jgi:VIT1/CCC1 family predicted Fe2+/Mn2+ transporter
MAQNDQRIQAPTAARSHRPEDPMSPTARRAATTKTETPRKTVKAAKSAPVVEAKSVAEAKPVAEAGAESAARDTLLSRVRNLAKPPSSPHETRGASVVRPVVFGATDGLVCNLSLIMGVAGAAKEDPHSIVVAGVAGLLAGGFSMAVGEYVSVRSQRELLDYQIELQRHQLHHTPEQERTILLEIYEAKGLSRPEAELIVGRIMKDPERAIDTFVREEIGLSAETMGSPVAAGLGSLSAFAVGAFVPLLPFILWEGKLAFGVSIAASALALFAIGLAVSRLTHRHALMTGVRQVVLGGLAAAVTFGVGSLMGASVH